jgi:hypothetical protein
LTFPLLDERIVIRELAVPIREPTACAYFFAGGLVRLFIRVSATLAVAVLAGCSNSTGPYYYPIGGIYNGTITYEMAGDPALLTPIVPGISVTLNDPDGMGNLAGTFAFNQGYTATGNIAAQFISNGTEINFTQFGDAGQPIFYVGSFLSTSYSRCNLSASTFNLNPNGGFDGAGNFDMDGVYTGVRCAVPESDSVTTTLSVSLAVFNPNPEAVRNGHKLPGLVGGSTNVH